MKKTLSEQVLESVNHSVKVNTKNEDNHYTKGNNKRILEINTGTTIEIDNDVITVIGFYFSHNEFNIEYKIKGNKKTINYIHYF